MLLLISRNQIDIRNMIFDGQMRPKLILPLSKTISFIGSWKRKGGILAWLGIPANFMFQSTALKNAIL